MPTIFPRSRPHATTKVQLQIFQNTPILSQKTMIFHSGEKRAKEEGEKLERGVIKALSHAARAKGLDRPMAMA